MHPVLSQPVNVTAATTTSDASAAMTSSVATTTVIIRKTHWLQRPVTMTEKTNTRNMKNQRQCKMQPKIATIATTTDISNTYYEQQQKKYVSAASSEQDPYSIHLLLYCYVLRATCTGYWWLVVCKFFTYNNSPLYGIASAEYQQ